MHEFPGKELSESAGKLFCKACRENIAVKRSVVLNHIKSRKHAESKEKLKKRVARELDIAEALQAHDADAQKWRNVANRTKCLQGESCHGIHEGWNSSVEVGML